MKKILLMSTDLSELAQEVLGRMQEEFQFPDDSPHPICLVAIGSREVIPLEAFKFSKHQPDGPQHVTTTVVGVCNPDRLIAECEEDGKLMIDHQKLGHVAIRLAILNEIMDGKVICVERLKITLDGVEQVEHKERNISGKPTTDDLVESLIEILEIGEYRTAANQAHLAALRETLKKLNPKE